MWLFFLIKLKGMTIIMVRYVIKRLIMIIPILIGVTLLLFILLAMTPGDPAVIAIGPGAQEEQIELFKIQNGLDKPLYVQYVTYMAKAVTGNLGVSYTSRQTVSSMISVRVGATLFLSLTSMAITIIVALFLGIAMAVKQNSIFDNFMRVLTIIFTSMPQFWLALMLLLLFSVQLKWLPSANLFKQPGDWILPIVCLAFNGITVCARTGRSSMLEVINQDYIRTARAKGLKRNYIIRRHALKNSLLPMVSIYGRIIGQCFSGSVVLETVFGINGIGSMMTYALRQKDVPAIMGCIIISACIITVVNLLTDLTYAFIDPRIKSMYTRRKNKPIEVASGAMPVQNTIVIPIINADLSTGEFVEPQDVSFSIDVETLQNDKYSTLQIQKDDKNRDFHLAIETQQSTFTDEDSHNAEHTDSGLTASLIINGRKMPASHLEHPDDIVGLRDPNGYKKSLSTYKKRSLWADVWKRLRKNKTAVAGMIVFMVILLACLGSPLLYNYNDNIIAVNILNQMTAPSKDNLLGVDDLGRDILARILWGGRTTLLLSFCGLGIAFVLGAILGTVAAYYGGAVDTVIMRFMDIVMSIPSILLMITLATLMNTGIVSLIFVVGFGLIPGQARMVRGQVLQVVDNEYIEAVRVQGASDLKIITSHILPNALSPIITTVILDVAFAVMVISTLSFLGLGVQPPDPEWGGMLATGRQYLRFAPHISTFPGIALTITLMALTLVGDGLRDALDPRMKR